MDFQTLLLDFLGQNAFLIILAVFIIVCIFAGVRIVPQSEQFRRSVSAGCGLY